MMQTRRLGSSGLEVGVIGLGGMPLSLRGRPSGEDAVRVIHAALDAGMTLIDTADVYCLDHRDIGHNERLIARALKEWPGRHDVVVATKGGLERPHGDWTTNGHPEHLRAACEASLTALEVEAITLYQLHAPDPRVPFAESVGALAELRAAGKIQHLGLSNVSAGQIAEALAIVPVVSVQNRHSPFDRHDFADGVMERCEGDGLAYLPYSPVGGSHGKGRIAVDPTLNEVAARHDASPFEVALAFLVASSPVMIPIPGASHVESARSSARAGDLVLTAVDLEELEAAFPRV